MAWFLLRPFGRMRCSGKLPIVPEIRTMAFHIAEYVSAVSSVTTSPERDCDPRMFQSVGFQALGSFNPSPNIFLIPENSFKNRPPCKRI